jgi:hypothetical protein
MMLNYILRMFLIPLFIAVNAALILKIIIYWEESIYPVLSIAISIAAIVVVSRFLFNRASLLRIKRILEEKRSKGLELDKVEREVEIKIKMFMEEEEAEKREYEEFKSSVKLKLRGMFGRGE